MMKYSKYNFQFHSEKYGHLLYNSLTNCFVELDDETALVLNDYKNGIANTDSDFINEDFEQFVKAKIFVENDYDEFLNIKFQKHLGRFNKSRMNLTIATTLHCNLSCHYCFEESRPNVYMTDKVEEQLIQFIRLHSDVKRINITWYGGEPLLDFNRIISLSNKIKNLGIDYSSSIITNGYLLSEEVINKFSDLNIRRIHITIDGPEEIHNKRRPHIKEKSSFAVIYNNMLRLIPKLKNESIRLTVRVNIDKTNENYYNIIYKKIRNDFAGISVSIYPGIVKKSYGSCSSIDDILMDNQAHADFNIEQYRKYGIKSPEFFPIKHNGECMARQIYGYLIDARGDIYKCWTDTGKKSESIGNIGNQKDINTKLMIRYLTGGDVFDKKECQECIFLPVCGGGCPHLAIKKAISQNSINLCHIAKGNLKEFLEIYYEIKKEIKPVVC